MSGGRQILGWLPNLPAADLYKVDLSGANLSRADLRGADLGRANLISGKFYEANLGRANFREAYLSVANLKMANLRGAWLDSANLRGANLSEADLSAANLGAANLGGANLGEANLREANLRGAKLDGARFLSSILADVDLSEVKGLEKVRHIGPSEISINMICKSKGKIPEVFLRGCGVPEEIIAIAVSLRSKAIESYSCFISYSGKDDAFAKRVHADLQDKGVRVWFAPEDLKIGDKFPVVIEDAIRVYDKLMLVLSKHSINSAWVRREVQTALAKEKKEKRAVLFPIRLDDAFLKTTEDWADDIRRNRHVGDFKQWKDHDHYQAAFDRLLRDLKASEAK